MWAAQTRRHGVSFKWAESFSWSYTLQKLKALCHCACVHCKQEDETRESSPSIGLSVFLEHKHFLGYDSNYSDCLWGLMFVRLPALSVFTVQVAPWLHFFSPTAGGDRALWNLHSLPSLLGTTVKSNAIQYNS